jgi:hypothetical protein
MTVRELLTQLQPLPRDQRFLAALRRLRAAFGFVEILRIIDHNDDQYQDDDQPIEEGEQPPPAGR